jgi:hypothetical protein
MIRTFRSIESPSSSHVVHLSIHDEKGVNQPKKKKNRKKKKGLPSHWNPNKLEDSGQYRRIFSVLHG